jgi:hypothetical protein
VDYVCTDDFDLCFSGRMRAMNQRLIELYDEYTHRPLDRRVFLERLIALAGSATAAQAFLSVIEPNYALAAVVAADDPRVGSVSLEASPDLKGYLAFPKAKGSEIKDNLFIVIHENRGLNPHIQDVARRVALEGFHAFAADFLTPYGGTPKDEDQARDMFAKIDMGRVIKSAADLIAGLKLKNPRMKIGTVGFCWGGGAVNSIATAAPGLDADGLSAHDHHKRERLRCHSHLLSSRPHGPKHFGADSMLQLARRCGHGRRQPAPQCKHRSTGGCRHMRRAPGAGLSLHAAGHHVAGRSGADV